MPLAAIKPHSTQPQVGSTSHPSQIPRGAQITAPISPVNAAKRTSPPAFLAMMFQMA